MSKKKKTILIYNFNKFIKIIMKKYRLVFFKSK